MFRSVKSNGSFQSAAIGVLKLQKSEISTDQDFLFLRAGFSDRVCRRLTQCYPDPTALPIQVSLSRCGLFALWTEGPGDWRPEHLMAPIQAVVGQEWPVRCRLLDSVLELGEGLSLVYDTEL